MTKERSTAFFDAVFAIIMTILVLELERPETLTWSAIWALRESFLAYAISFFWLGTMWINIHNMWDIVKTVSMKTIWMQIILLFFSSFFPYTTDLVSNNFNNSVAQVLYGLVVIGVTFSFLAMTNSVLKDNADDEEYMAMAAEMGIGRWNGWMKYDVLMKIAGIVLSFTVFPPATLLMVLITLIFLVLPNQLKVIRKG